MAGSIFINYRRGDDPGFTQALYQRLEDEFGPENLFMDVEGHIKPGDDFVRVLDAQVGQADIVLAVIGPRWSDLLSKREGDGDDFVAIEIKSALERSKRVIPVLVGGSMMPRADALPEPIRQLARRNAVGLRPERFKADCQGLINALKEQLAEAVREREATSVRERASAEEARRQRETEDAARLAAAEAREQARRLEGLDPEQIRKAEELANWQYVGERGTLSDLRDHLARYPGGVTERAALLKLEDAAWTALPPEPEAAALRTYLEEFPKAIHAVQARKRLGVLEAAQRAEDDSALSRLKETDEWLALATSTDKTAIQSFIKAWPHGQHANAARQRLKEMGGARTGRYAVAFAAAVGLTAFAATSWGAIEGYVTGWHRGFDFSAHYAKSTIVKNKEECEQACRNNPECRAVSFDLPPRGQCYQYHDQVVWAASWNASRYSKLIR